MHRSTEIEKTNVIAFCEMMFNDCQPQEAIAKYAGKDYIQHNPHVADGKDGFLTYFNKMAEDYPGKRVEVKRAIADGQHVVLHCHQIWPEGLEYAGIDIFRLYNEGKVVEHWNVLQVIPDSSANENGMF